MSKGMKLALFSTLMTACLLHTASSTPVIAQSLLPIPGVQRINVLMYERLGVYFWVKDQEGVFEATLFPPVEEASHAGKRIRPREGEVIPGVGALGIILGDSQDRLRSLKRVKSSTGIVKTSGPESYAQYDFTDGSKLFVNISDGRVRGIEVLGKFHTSPGITERSTESDIYSAYGKPDITSSIPDSATVRKLWIIAAVAMSVAGCLAGWLSHLIMRRANSHRAIRVGASSLVTAFSSIIGISIVMLAGCDEVRLPVLSAATASGTLGALACVLMYPVFGNSERKLKAVVADLVVGISCAYLVVALWSRTPIPPSDYLGFAITLVTFLLCFPVGYIQLTGKSAT